MPSDPSEKPSQNTAKFQQVCVEGVANHLPCHNPNRDPREFHHVKCMDWSFPTNFPEPFQANSKVSE